MDQRSHNPRRRRKKNNNVGIIRLLILLFLMLALLLAVNSCNRGKDEAPNPPDNSNSSQSTTSGSTDGEDETTGTTAPTQPYVVSTASVGVTGDILAHGPLINSAKSAANKADSYDFSGMFTYIAPYYNKYDFMVANLEVTLGGPDAGKYQGYPTFNCPDSMVDALQGAGVDMLLTANNHSYDTGYNGMMRTQEVLDEKNMLHIGTRSSEEDPHYLVQDINGIKVGMVCYTYETNGDSPDRKYLNGILLSKKAAPLVNSFNYDKLDAFYDNVEETLASMKAEGAEATMLYIHWGEEYELKPRNYQKEIAQSLCDLGVDVIVGGHPHVIQPFDTLTSEDGHKTYCIYSTGNALSNQRRNTLKTPTTKEYTEDGMIFGVEFQKWNDGTVEISEVSILPTWVNREQGNGVYNYSIIPLDIAVEAWDGYKISSPSRTIESYNHTLSIVGEGLNDCREALGLEAMPLSLEKDSR